MPRYLLAQYFEKKKIRIVQAHGLDGKGTPADSVGSSDKSIVVEKVSGRKEALYWERVPEKVCSQAVQKVIKLSSGDIKPLDDGAMPGQKGKRHQRLAVDDLFLVGMLHCVRTIYCWECHLARTDAQVTVCHTPTHICCVTSSQWQRLN